MENNTYENVTQELGCIPSDLELCYGACLCFSLDLLIREETRVQILCVAGGMQLLQPKPSVFS